MAIFGKPKYSKVSVKKVQIPDGRWMRCENCAELLDSKDFEQLLRICPKCGHHYPMAAKERINMLIDAGTFEEWDSDLTSTDPLKFEDLKKYSDRLEAAKKKSGLKDAIITGKGMIKQIPVAIGVMDFSFIGGSMGSVVGEKFTRTVERAIKERLPVIAVTASGGARMMESLYSLMQMAKTSGALAKLDQEKLLYISVLTHPTSGGVTASFASLGDVIVAEPGALIGFAGPRVIQQTIRQDLPEGFQRSEFNQDHGMVDVIVDRKDMKEKLGQLLNFFTAQQKQQAS